MTTKFGERIKKLRKSFGLSQKEAAAKLSVSQAQLSHYENGIRECSLDFIVELSTLYGVSCDYILGASSDKISSKNMHRGAIALDAVLSAAEKMQDAASCENITKAADCCVFALANATAGEKTEFDKNAANCSLAAAKIFLSAVRDEVTISDLSLSSTLKNAQESIKAITKLSKNM